MSFVRATVQDNGLVRAARQGDGLLAFLTGAAVSADANSTLTAAQLAGGLILRSGMTASRTDTTDTGANLAAAFPMMDIGDSFTFIASSQVAFTQVLAGGTGVTASGNLTVPANGFKIFLLQKTGAATFNLIGL